jgi:DNA-binding MurR/RpiR family transcriptional regulator
VTIARDNPVAITNGRPADIRNDPADLRYAAVVSAPALAQETGVSQAMVTRAAQALGFSGYPDLQATIRERFAGPASDRLVATSRELEGTSGAVMRRVMLEDAENIRASAEDLTDETVQRVVDCLLAARQVYVHGARGSHGLARILAYVLSLLLPVRTLAESPAAVLDDLVGLTPQDVVVVISFHAGSPPRRMDCLAVDLMCFAEKVGAPRIVITDQISGHLARLATLKMIVRLSRLRLTPSYAPGASVINGLVTAIALSARDVAAPRLAAAEQLWGIFDSDFEPEVVQNEVPSRARRTHKRS